MTLSSAISLVASGVLSLISIGGIKDWKEANTWDRFRMVMPGVIAIVLAGLVLSKSKMAEVRHKDPRRRASSYGKQ